MNEPGYQSPYIIEPDHLNSFLYKRICKLFEADIPLVDGNNHKISKIYKDKIILFKLNSSHSMIMLRILVYLNVMRLM